MWRAIRSDECEVGGQTRAKRCRFMRRDQPIRDQTGHQPVLAGATAIDDGICLDLHAAAKADKMASFMRRGKPCHNVAPDCQLAGTHHGLCRI